MGVAVAGVAPLDQILAQAAKRRAKRRGAAEQQRARRAKQDSREPPSESGAPTSARGGKRPAGPNDFRAEEYRLQTRATGEWEPAPRNAVQTSG